MKWRPWAGALLIALSIAAMYFWETGLRDRIELRSVLVFSRDIAAREQITEDCFRLIRTTPQAVVPGGLDVSDIPGVVGLSSAFSFRENQQVLGEYFSAAATAPAGYTSFPLETEWVGAVSQLNREDDLVCVYIAQTGQSLGCYRIRVLPASGKRMEIACSLEEYLAIRSAAEELGPGSLIVANSEYR